MRYRVMRYHLRVDNLTSRFFRNVDGAKTPFHRRCGFLSVLPVAYLYHVYCINYESAKQTIIGTKQLSLVMLGTAHHVKIRCGD